MKPAEFETYAELKKLAAGIKKQNVQLVRRTIELTELKGNLEDRNYDLGQSYKKVEKQNTELVRKTIELAELRGILEDRNYQLQLANKRVTGLLNAKTEFMNQAAHDLRTPLTAIVTLIPLIRKKVGNRQVLHDFAIVENNVRYLNGIVKELLALIKKDSAEYGYQHEDIDIRKLVNEILLNEGVILKSSKVKVIKKIAHSLPPVTGNRLKLTEVIQNIMANAVKFMPEGGTLTVSAYENNNFIYVKVNDTGIGMEKGTLLKLFSPFFKADASRHSEGSGLGFSICKKIVEAHNGAIWAESEGRNRGSTVTFRLPVNKTSF